MNAFKIRVAWEWAVRCFGIDHCIDKRVRALRFLEEAVELAQAVGLEPEKIKTVVDVVYAKPVGDEFQELGGVMLTLAVLLEALGWNHDKAFENELCRVLELPPEHFKKRNQEKLDLGLTG